MKTTVQISDGLFNEARREHTTLEALIEEGLRRLISDRTGKESFHLRKESLKGQGLQAHLAGASWEEIRKLGYEGRGG